MDLSVQIPFRLPQIADLVTQPFNKLQKQESHQLQSSCLAPRIIAIQEHGFSHEVAAQMEAPQRSSTRAVYKSKWFHSHEVDFRAPSENQIADFLLYLFKERNLQPNTIEGYRTAIADMVSNHNLNISMDENLTRLLDSFQRDKPKGRRGVPSWNLSLVLHQLTKAPFEPLGKASLKHLSFKTVFLLALGSGKRVKSMPGCRRISDIRRTGVRFLFTLLPVFSLKPASSGWPGLSSSGGHSGFSPYFGQVSI